MIREVHLKKCFLKSLNAEHGQDATVFWVEWDFYPNTFYSHHQTPSIRNVLRLTLIHK